MGALLNAYQNGPFGFSRKLYVKNFPGGYVIPHFKKTLHDIAVP
jgi:hypothetical protein